MSLCFIEPETISYTHILEVSNEAINIYMQVDKICLSKIVLYTLGGGGGGVKLCKE